MAGRDINGRTTEKQGGRKTGDEMDGKKKRKEKDGRLAGKENEGMLERRKRWSSEKKKSESLVRTRDSGRIKGRRGGWVEATVCTRDFEGVEAGGQGSELKTFKDRKKERILKQSANLRSKQNRKVRRNLGPKKDRFLLRIRSDVLFVLTILNDCR